MPRRRYVLRYKKSVDKDLRKLSQAIRTEIVRRVQSLATDPHPLQAAKLRGSKDLYRLRYADYRIIYQIKDRQLIVLVIKVGHRREIYRNF